MLLPRSWRRAIESSTFAGGVRTTLGQTKQESELAYWRSQHRQGGGVLRRDDYYRSLTLQIADWQDAIHVTGRVVVDIGCGPRGSLCWMKQARLRIGVDPLADAYRELGISDQPMTYLGAAAERLPLGDETVDIVLTVNALDHVDNVDQACAEIRRILKPGGLFIGSINLREVPTATEPSIVTREQVESNLIGGWRIERLRVFPECDVPGDAYRYARQAPPPGYRAEMMVLWCLARKPEYGPLAEQSATSGAANHAELGRCDNDAHQRQNDDQ
ncbi:MAG: class I SAM-dependent methyltransferase [Phycisphaerae bacterium]|nr:class I SAM-dependent methyltransferase [Phycisphaerae bacterium]